MVLRDEGAHRRRLEDKLIHSVTVTGANVHDSQQLEQLLHGSEERVYGDSAYIGQKARIRAKSPGARDFASAKSHANRPLTDRQRETNRRP